MKCVSIVYKKTNQQNILGEFIPIRPFKKNVQNYYQKLIERDMFNKTNLKKDHQIVPNFIGTARSFRPPRRQSVNIMAQSINILPIRGSTCDLMRTLTNPQMQNRNQKKFRTTLVKKNDSATFFNLKGIKQNNEDLITNERVKLSSKFELDQTKKHAKLKNLKKLKLIKPTTLLISIDFILNENNFWGEDSIQQNCFKNWKTLQECTNIVWITKRENSFKKLQKYANQYGLRLDGVYQIISKKKSSTLNFTLRDFERDFFTQVTLNKNQKYRREIILINSLKVDSIKDLGYQQFYSAFPIVKSIKCVVHFIQIDINDKQRFNSPLKILSKEKLPCPNSVALFFKNFQENQAERLGQSKTLCHHIDKDLENNEIITRDEMLQKFQDIKKDCMDYFSQNLHISMNKKIKTQNNEISLQFLIGDMFKRNFSLLYSYQNQSNSINKRLNILHENTNKITNEKNRKNILKSLKFESQLQQQHQFNKPKQQEVKFKFPVYFWKK